MKLIIAPIITTSLTIVLIFITKKIPPNKTILKATKNILRLLLGLLILWNTASFIIALQELLYYNAKLGYYYYSEHYYWGLSGCLYIICILCVRIAPTVWVVWDFIKKRKRKSEASEIATKESDPDNKKISARKKPEKSKNKKKKGASAENEETVIYCKSCKKPVNPDNIYCLECGHRIE